MNLYQAHILDHYHNPRNIKPLVRPDHAVTVTNTTCGDTITLQVIFDKNIISQLSFSGSGCILSQATASLVTHAHIGKTCDEIQALNDKVLDVLLGFQLGPNRLQCARLSVTALKTLILHKQEISHD